MFPFLIASASVVGVPFIRSVIYACASLSDNLDLIEKSA